MTYKQIILHHLSIRNSFNLGGMSCMELTKEIIKERNLDSGKARYASGGVSSTLRKMVFQGILRVSSKLTKRGGNIYYLPQ